MLVPTKLHPQPCPFIFIDFVLTILYTYIMHSNYAYPSLPLCPILIKPSSPPYNSHSHLHVLIFVLWPIEFYEGHLNDHRYGTIPQSLVGSIVGTYLKMMTTSSPESLSFWETHEVKYCVGPLSVTTALLRWWLEWLCLAQKTFYSLSPCLLSYLLPWYSLNLK